MQDNEVQTPAAAEAPHIWTAHCCPKWRTAALPY